MLIENGSKLKSENEKLILICGDEVSYLTNSHTGCKILAVLPVVKNGVCARILHPV